MTRITWTRTPAGDYMGKELDVTPWKIVKTVGGYFVLHKMTPIPHPAGESYAWVQVGKRANLSTCKANAEELAAPAAEPTPTTYDNPEPAPVFDAFGEQINQNQTSAPKVLTMPSANQKTKKPKAPAVKVDGRGNPVSPFFPDESDYARYVRAVYSLGPEVDVQKSILDPNDKKLEPFDSHRRMSVVSGLGTQPVETLTVADLSPAARAAGTMGKRTPEDFMPGGKLHHTTREGGARGAETVQGVPEQGRWEKDEDGDERWVTTPAPEAKKAPKQRLTATEQPAPGGMIGGTEARPTVYGHAVTALLRWMGAEGWSVSRCLETLRAVGVTGIAEATVRIQTKAGARGDGSRGPTPELTEEQAHTLEVLAKQ